MAAGRVPPPVRRRSGGHGAGARARPSTCTTATAHARLAADVPGIKVIAVVRDPVDRAVSNLVHLRADGLEPESDFLTAVRLEEQRIEAGWAPFWHYRGLGRYGEQLRDLYRHVPRENVFLLRYRAAGRQPARDAGPGQRLPRCGAGDRPHGGPGERQALRPRRRPVPGAGAAGAGGRGPRLATPIRRCGARRAVRCSPPCTPGARRGRRCRSRCGARSSSRCCPTSSCSRS